MMAARFLAFSIGFLSLSLEILWIRLSSFTNHSLPQSFAFVLVFYLGGIALGAQAGRVLCDYSRNPWKICGLVLVFSGLFDCISPWIYALTYTRDSGGLIIAISALLKAMLFPVAHHLGTPEKNTAIGRSVSRVYVANILGATFGPMVTGVVLLSFFTTQQCFFICAGFTLLLALYCLQREVRLLLTSLCALSSMVCLLAIVALDGDKLLKIIVHKQGVVRRIIENQHGIVMTYQGGAGGDYVTGGNVYDGRTNLDPVLNSNKINRLTILSALQDKPEHVLMIGLSIGTWLKIITTFPGVERIDVVEINPGYLKAINDYPSQKSGLQDSRVHLYIADGRHWLKVHPSHRYDLIVMNTTFYWRNYASNLLSQEFLQLMKQHMNPGAVLTYNTTFSPDVLKTAASVFQNVYLYDNFIITADFDWRKRLRQPDAIKKLAALQLDGAPLYPRGSTATIKAHLSLPLLALEAVEAHYHAHGRTLEVITDKNLITEYKYGLKP